MRSLIDSGIIVVLSTAMLFALSIANFNAYLTAVGVEPGFVLRNSHQILYNSLFVILVPTLKVAIWGVILLPFLYLFANIYTAAMKKWKQLKYAVVRFRRRTQKNSHSRAESAAIKCTLRLYPIFIVALLIFWSLWQAERAGTKKGEALLEKIQTSNYESHEVVTISNYANQIYVIACGINNCGGIDVTDLKAVYFENKFIIGDSSNQVKVTK